MQMCVIAIDIVVWYMCLPSVLDTVGICISALNIASPGNQLSANCIGTLSFRNRWRPGSPNRNWHLYPTPLGQGMQPVSASTTMLHQTEKLTQSWNLPVNTRLSCVKKTPLQESDTVHDVGILTYWFTDCLLLPSTQMTLTPTYSTKPRPRYSISLL